MKIENLLQSLQHPGKTANKKSKGFQQVLETELLAQTKHSKDAVPTQAAAGAPVSPELRLEGLTLTEATIDTLDSFSAALADQALKTEELEPYVAALEEDVAAILAAKKELPAKDPLATLLDRVATVSYLETAKYRRGDYA